MLIDSTEYLTAAQTAARLGIKAETLYAYVSRGQLPRHRASDGRTSLFAASDVARLERRKSARRGAPADVTVASELTLVDKTDGHLWYRGLDALEVCRERRFEEVAAWLWTGDFVRLPPFRAEAALRTKLIRAQGILPKTATPAQRLPVIASALAALTADTASTVPFATRTMGALVDALPGQPARSVRFADRVAAKLGARKLPKPLLHALESTMSLVCEHGLTYPTLSVRLTVAAGGGIEHAIAAGMHTVASSLAALSAIEEAFAIARRDGAMRAADTLDLAAIEAASWKEPYRSGDPRGTVIDSLLRTATPDAAEFVEMLRYELIRRGAPHPTAAFDVAGMTWACGMPPGSAAAVLMLARSVGWIAHALEEHRRPTPYRPRLAYTGHPPRTTASTRRTLHAVQEYLSS